MFIRLDITLKEYRGLKQYTVTSCTMDHKHNRCTMEHRSKVHDVNYCGLFQVVPTMPRSKTGKKREPIDPEALKNAIKAVCAEGEENISIRQSCKVFNMKFTTLVRHLAAFKTQVKMTFNIM